MYCKCVLFERILGITMCIIFIIYYMRLVISDLL
jgi:hypothetical protein